MAPKSFSVAAAALLVAAIAFPSRMLATSIVAIPIAPALAGSPTGLTFDPVTNTYFVVTGAPPQIAQVDATGALVTAPHNPAAQPYVNPMPLAPPAPPAPLTAANLAIPILLGPNAPAASTPPVNPSGVALDFFTNTLYVTDYSFGNDSFIIVIGAGPDGVLLTADDEIRYWNVRQFVGASSGGPPALIQPEGIAFHPVFGTLFVLDGQSPGGVFEISESGVQINSFVQTQAARPQGIAVDPTTGHLLILDDPAAGPQSQVYEFTTGGSLVGAVGTVPVGGLTDIAYNSANGSVIGVGSFGQNPAVQGLIVGATQVAGPANGGLPLTTMGGLLSDHLASTVAGTPAANFTGPGAVLLAPAGLMLGAPSGFAASVAITIGNTGATAPPLGAPIVAPAVTNVYQIATQFSPADVTFSPPAMLILPLVARGTPGTPVGLFVFQQFVQAAVLPQPFPFTVSGPIKAMGSVDPSGMTATFRSVAFF